MKNDDIGIGRYVNAQFLGGQMVHECEFCGALVSDRVQHNKFHVEVQSWLDALRFYLDTLKQASGE